MKKKILFVNDEMQIGGVARILNTLLKMIDRNKYDIDLLVLHHHGEMLKEVPKDIKVIKGSNFFNAIDIPLKKCTFRNIFSKLRLLLYMKTGLIKNKIAKERKKILTKKYDIEFSAKEGFCTIFNAYGDSKFKCNWIQVDYLESNYSSNHMKLVKQALANIDLNIACSEKVKTSYQKLFEVNNIVVIKNLIDQKMIRNLALEKCDLMLDDEKINLITVARFHPQKAVDRLIRIFSKLQAFYTLTIIGDGDLKQELQHLAKQLNVFEKINWLGYQKNPYNYIKKMDLFVMSSIYEGYPTITLESLISSTPVLSTDVAGIKSQITEKHYGYVIDNSEEALYKKLLELKDSKKQLLEYKKQLDSYDYENSKILKELDEYLTQSKIYLKNS